MSEIKNALEKLKKDAYQEFQNENKPTPKESLSYFSRCISYSSKLIFKEKEIITFAILQFVCIGLGYYLWVQILDLIPEDVWESAKKHPHDGSYVDLVLLLWTFLCVGLTTYPLGLLTACMGVAHFLHETKKESTIAECFRIVLAKAWPIWIFSWIDSWWTVNRFLKRILNKHDHTPLSQKIIDETIYQAWKTASIGFFPALIVGRDIMSSCKDSLGILKTHFKTICQLRIAYSTICLILYLFFFISIFFTPFIFTYTSNSHTISPSVYDFYTTIGLPFLTVLFFIQVFFRPIYIISACSIYSTYARENNIPIVLPRVSGFSNTIVAFLVLALIIATIFLYRDTLEITQLLSIPYE